MIEATASQVRKLVERALDGAERLPIPDQADLYQAAAIAFSPVDPEASAATAFLAHLMRESERQQLQFRELLKR